MRRLDMSCERELGSKGTKENVPAFHIIPMLYPAAQACSPSHPVL